MVFDASFEVESVKKTKIPSISDRDREGGVMISLKYLSFLKKVSKNERVSLVIQSVLSSPSIMKRGVRTGRRELEEQLSFFNAIFQPSANGFDLSNYEMKNGLF